MFFNQKVEGEVEEEEEEEEGGRVGKTIEVLLLSETWFVDC